MKAADSIVFTIATVRGAIVLAVVWSLLVLGSLFMQRGQLNRTAAELARIAAIANLKKDMAIRDWAASVEGVFIREKYVFANTSLDQEERYTALDRRGVPVEMVQVTPMHLLLAIQSMSNKESGFRERLTANQLHNRDNLPDDWEKSALKQLGKGADMVSEALPQSGGHGLMRVMIPMKMEKECLECHRDTLIPVGGLRGGAAVSLDLNTYLSAQEPAWRAMQYWHGGIWLLGLSAMSVFHFFSRRRALELVRQDQGRRENAMAFAAMAEGAAIADADGAILWVNDAFCAITGYERDEAIGVNPKIFRSDRHDAAFYEQIRERLLGDGLWRGELWSRRKNGDIYPVEISVQAARRDDGSVQRYISIFSDISQRKEIEQNLADYSEHLEELVHQRTEMTRFLQNVREDERASIARELHDELGQALTALRIDLGLLRRQCTEREGNGAMAQRVGTSCGLVERTLVSLRRISEGLRPGMLDVLGLGAALEHLVCQFAERTAIQYAFHADSDEYNLTENQAITVFRLVQEALTNISRHAQATKVDIELRQADGKLHLVVQDDGIGFDTSLPRKGFGLLGMSERVSMLDGEMTVTSGHGTRIAVSLPLAREQVAAPS
jgi:PAS domain S-box-containing protein